MLVLSRKAGQTVLIGPDITLRVGRIESGIVRLAIEAPAHVVILRGELVDRGEVLVASGGDSLTPDLVSRG
jgi:carbon storage regulator